RLGSFRSVRSSRPRSRTGSPISVLRCPFPLTEPPFHHDRFAGVNSAAFGGDSCPIRPHAPAINSVGELTAPHLAERLADVGLDPPPDGVDVVHGAPSAGPSPNARETCRG